MPGEGDNEFVSWLLWHADLSDRSPWILSMASFFCDAKKGEVGRRAE